MVLGIETSGQAGSVAVWGSAGIIAYSEYDEPNAHAENLLAHVESAICSTGCHRNEVERIAVSTGPGNFSGIRAGIALATGIGMGLGVPVTGICSLAAIAFAFGGPGLDATIVVRDARRNELFCGVFTGDGDAVMAPSLVPAKDFEAWLDLQIAQLRIRKERWAIVGDGLNRLDNNYVARLESNVPPHAKLATPNARQVAKLGVRISQGSLAVPNYLRGADAVLPNLTANPLGELRKRRIPVAECHDGATK